MKNDFITQAKTGKLFRDGIERQVEDEVDLQIDNIRSNMDEIVACVLDKAETEGVELTASLVRAVMRDRLDY